MIRRKKIPNLWAVVLAGGEGAKDHADASGSTDVSETPGHDDPLGQQTPVQKTMAHIRSCVPPARSVIVASESYHD